MKWTILCALSLFWLLWSSGVSAVTDATPTTLGHETLMLNGPWRFHTGDDPSWADPGFDDSGWESMDLTAPPGANDGDVGITPYTSGWNAKGHPGYRGYAWYRLRFTVMPPVGETLALLGPWAVDSSYQIYANGKLLGGIGDFSRATPTAHGYHYPHYFTLPPGMVSGGPMVLAVRVWAGPWVAGPSAGGMHVAPVIGTQVAITDQYRLQWLKIFEGYTVDAVPALMLLLMAVMVLCLWPLDRTDRAYPWLAVALVLSAIQRGNQAFFFWWQIETVQDLVVVILTLVSPCSLGAWMMAWRAWFKLDKPAWLPKLVATLTAIYAITQLLAHPWILHATFPHAVASGVNYLSTGAHLAFLLVYLLIVFQGMRRQGREGWYALPAVLAIGTVLFIMELVAVHVPGIWFPFGVGLSITECASAIFTVLLFVLLVHRLWSHARNVCRTASGSRGHTARIDG